eukprot:1988770-Alexandrium_andersonii.AAC.1
MAEAAGPGPAPDEAEAPQGLGAKGSPPGRRASCPVKTPCELSVHPGLGNLRGQHRVHIVDERVR